jgi:tetratricopeptide (TPR) repeat protein
MTSPTWTTKLDDLKRSLALREREAANRAVSGLLDAHAPLGVHWRSISELMRVSGELTLAMRAIDAFVASQGQAPQALYSKVVLLTQCGRMREAHDLLRQLPGDVPDPAGHAYVVGNTALAIGQVDQARDFLEQAVRLRPGWGPAWLTLASAIDLKSDALANRMLADRNAALRHSPAEIARYFYALGKLYADRGDPASAFESFAEGARLLRKEVPYSREANAANARQAMSGFAPNVLRSLKAGSDFDSGRVIFVTGLPRSGTTLVEQILTSHSQVADGAELNLIQHAAVRAGGVSGQQLQSYVDSGRSPRDVAALYLRLVGERFGNSGRIVDKTVDVSRFMGLIATMLPDAPLIWMHRDPLDTAWSCFRTFFIHGVAWSYDLADIAHHFSLEEELRHFWKRQLGDRLLVLPYGQLVEDPEQWTRRLLKHCSLAEEPAVFMPHATKRTVLTASAMQVRRPINRAGLGVANAYRPWLGPFIDAYRGQAQGSGQSYPSSQGGGDALG